MCGVFPLVVAGALGALWSEAAAVVGMLAVSPAVPVLAVRGYRAAVLCGGDRVRVRGLLRTRTISRAAITAVTDLPAIRWTDLSGRRRWTPVMALMSGGGEAAAVARWKEESLGRLRRWAGPSARA
ncbi:hypothetical protein DVK44_11065 [Streptomyces paludis]|uniref:PH domain-containing protein n=1 Tax=Streptomyces paludis TaxID=2282738 RepID=A0A345HN85_9ACTN|nr:hypothetical protein DVK44_11065 [Streptomyces paludis]